MIPNHTALVHEWEQQKHLGTNYFCESGNNWEPELYIGDPLWDGQQCEGQCCTNGKSPPWFSVELNNTTTDDIEVCICADEGTNNEDTPIRLMEIYVSYYCMQISDNVSTYYVHALVKISLIETCE